MPWRQERMRFAVMGFKKCRYLKGTRRREFKDTINVKVKAKFKCSTL
jgi:hypothetical protein